jgi:hypothetical protein
MQSTRCDPLADGAAREAKSAKLGEGDQAVLLGGLCRDRPVRRLPLDPGPLRP